ncbi:MAG: CubicO group peptidase (beta-lactamase class C family) [Myxococcota bacterium]|jgi:CubicO group peptidase (beta-lactamase class C family)
MLLLTLLSCRPDTPAEDALWEGKNPGECDDGADNDGDGAFDCFDTDCTGAADCTPETTPEDSAEPVDTAEEAALVLAEARQASWEDLVDFADGWINYYGVPGLAFAVILDGEIAYASGMGTTQYGGAIPVTTDTIFRWNSVSKMHSALAVLQQVEAGNLDLHAPATDLLPDIDVTRGDPDELTLHRMMTHSTGMEDYWDTSCETSEEAFWNTTAPNNLVQPGAVYNYSNTGWSLVGRLIEEATGQDYADYMQEHILTPAGMTTATFKPAEAVGGSYSIGYDNGSFYTLDRHDCEYLRAATLLHGSVLDLGAMAEMMLDGGGGLVGDMSPMTTPQQETGYAEVSHHGYGMYTWSLDGVDVLSHSGGGAGHSSYFLLAPDQSFGIVAVTNASYYYAGNLALKAAELFLDFPKGQGTPDYFTDPKTWGEYEGTYEDPVYYGTVEVTLDDRYLYIRFADGANTDRRLYQSALDEFFYVYDGYYAYVRFVRDAHGTPQYVANRYWVGTRSDNPAAPPPALGPDALTIPAAEDWLAAPPAGHPRSQ